MIRLFVVILLVAAPVAAAPPAGFAARVDALRAEAGIPGMSVAIVENGTATFVQGFGVRALGSPAKVDADTLFPNGSTGKAFTTAALATLVDAGRIGWDDKVIDRLPWFRMYDPWVTREITIRDLLVHRSGLGLGEGDLLFVPRTILDRRESVRRLAFLKPATSFRSAFAYDNVLYMVAGQLIEEVTGQTWEDYVRKDVLRPAGMLESTTGSGERFAVADRAYPHARLDGGLRGAGTQIRIDERDELGRNGAPAGGMAVSAKDMLKWMSLQLAHGALADGTRLFSEAASKTMWSPLVFQPIADAPPGFTATKANFDGYALGWDVRDYRGTKIVWHSGAVFGFQAIVVLMPEQNVGFTMLINSEDGYVMRGLMYELLDHYLGLPKADWPEKLIALAHARVAEAVAAANYTAVAPSPAKPSLPLRSYAGDYVDPWYGHVAVTATASGLTIDFKTTPRMIGPLVPHQYDTFIARFTDPNIEPAFVTFGSMLTAMSTA
ncbi:serine hydrolase [Glacieibacterium megasporae]|uniref:serine hydrolase n=1 Tax=Glacieibacterium megasporae TaxID=2835787 RepID=UPI0034E21769